MKEMKVGIQELSMIKKLAENVDKGVRIVNLYHLLVQNLKQRHVLDLYNAVKQLFSFPSINKRTHLETIDGNT